jgi:hypothetical protein
VQEIDSWDAKFETYAAERNPISDILIQVKKQQPSGGSAVTYGRSSSVGRQLHQKRSGGASEDEDEEVDELSQIKRELDKCDVQLQKNGGMNCGWDAADHKDFLRIRTQHNNKTNTMAFATELMRAVPGLDEEKVHEHVNQYDLYLLLTDSKKQLLLQYKDAKKRA